MKIENNFVLGDCLEIIRDIPDNCFDLILIDPPYNIGDSNKLTKKDDKIISNKDAWDKIFKDSYSEREYFDLIKFLSVQFYRILKSNGNFITFFDRNKPYYLYPYYKKFEFKNMIALIKINPIPHIRKNNYRSGFELCAWFCKGKKSNSFNFISQKKMINVFYGGIGNKTKIHPTQKYEWMIEPLIRRHSRKNDLIGDFFAGSGTTLVIAKKLRRKYFGCEIKPKLYDIAKKRLESTNIFDTIVNFTKSKENLEFYIERG